MKKRFLSVAVAIAMCLALLPPFPAKAATTPTYYVDNNNVNITTAGTYIITQNDPNTPTSNTVNINPSTTGAVVDITLRDINIDATSASYNAAINISSDAQVTITLEGTNIVKSKEKKAGLQTSDSLMSESTLTIRGDGSLKAYGGDYGAGIGAAYNNGYGIHGSITIEGGNIEAYGGKGAAGIGGGDVVAYRNAYDRFADAGLVNINISGGRIYAEGKENPSETNDVNQYGAAGIGGGYFGGNTTINISGGDITAMGAAKAPCIGCSNYAMITISGGTIHTKRPDGYSYPSTYSYEIGKNTLSCEQMSSTEAGNSIIYVSGKDKISSWNKSTWKGIVWQGTAGQVYGAVDLTGKDLNIAAGETLTVPALTGDSTSPTLILSEGKFTNNGTITGDGIVRVDEKDYKIVDNTLVELGEAPPPKKQQDPLSITGLPETVRYMDKFQLGIEGGSGTGAVTWSGTAGQVMVTQDGLVNVIRKGDATITVTKAGDDEYLEATASCKFTAGKAIPNIGSVGCSQTIYPSTDSDTVVLTRTDSTVEGSLKLVEGTVFTPGEKEYNWVFTPTATGKYETATGTVSLTVATAALSRISVTTPPTKTAYTFGEALDPAGMVVTAAYSDGSSAPVTGYEVQYNSGTALKVGDTSVTISYTEGGVAKTCPLGGLTVNKKHISAQSAAAAASYSDTTAQKFDFSGLLPADCGNVTNVAVGPVTGAEILDSATGDKDAKAVTWALKPGLGNEEKSGSVTITIATENYEDLVITLTIRTTTKTPVTITGVTAQNWTYDGTAHTGYAGTPTAAGYSGEFDITYSGGSAPKNAGTYTVTFAVPENDPAYTGSAALNFTVEKAKIHITANDRIVTVGGTMPTLTATVSGLAAGDTLKAQPAVACESDLSTAGAFPITVSGAQVPDGGNYDTNITYHEGILTVRAETEPADLTHTGLILCAGPNGGLRPTPSGSYTAGAGTVEWDLDTLTLTLHNAAINATDAAYGNGVEIVAPADSTYPEVTILLDGNSSIRGKDAVNSSGILSQCPLRIAGSGTLAVTGGAASGGSSTGISCFGLTIGRGASVEASGGAAGPHSCGVRSTGAVTVSGTLKALAGSGSQAFGLLCDRALAVESGGVLEARAGTGSYKKYGIAFSGKSNLPVTVNGRLIAVGFTPLGNGSAAYQNKVSAKGSFNADGSGLTGFATAPAAFGDAYTDNNPLYILIEPESAPPAGRPSAGSSQTTVTTTTQNPDGSTTTKVEDKVTGTVTETTKAPDGSTTVVETKKDGTVATTSTDKAGNRTETVEKPDGSSTIKAERKDGTTATVTTDAGGRTEADVKLSAAAVSSAQESGTAIPLPLPQVPAAKDAQAAPLITVATGSGETVKVEIPVAGPTPGTVAVIVKADGTEEIVKTSIATAGGVAVALPDGAAVKIIDNGKVFQDVGASSWAADAVSFSSSHELFLGTSAGNFSPEAPMTRAMLMTVLARLDGEDTSGGSTWYEKGLAWAVSNQISDGKNPNGSITREQLAVMLYRYAGSPAVENTGLPFTDGDQASGYAQAALSWAVESGLLNGMGDGILNPQGNATRAQTAAVLMRFCQYMA